MRVDLATLQVVGPGGSLTVRHDDEVALKLLMLIEGESGDIGPCAAAAKFGYTRQRYYQLRSAYIQEGAAGLMDGKRGPKAPSRRTEEAVRQIIRHRFLHPHDSAEVIARKLSRSGIPISTSSVRRVLTEFGLQKRSRTMRTRSAGSVSPNSGAQNQPKRAKEAQLKTLPRPIHTVA
jgi:transposase